MATNDSLTGKRLAFVQALATVTTEQAAKAAGISERTAYRWIKDPQIITALNEAAAQTMQALSRRLIALGEKAAQVIDETLDNADASEGVRLRAAALALDKILQIRELVDLEQRLTALEAETWRGKL